MSSPVLPGGLDRLNGRRKYVFSVDEKDYFFRVITNDAELAKQPKARRDLGHIMYNSHLVQMQKCAQKGEKLSLTEAAIEEKFHSKSYTENWLNRLMPHGFEEENQVVFVLEDADANYVTAMLFNIDNPAQRAELKVPAEVDHFIYASRFITKEEFRGKSFLAGAFDKAVSMLSKRLGGVCECCVSISAVEATTSDGVKKHYVMNLPEYAQMWQQRFYGSSLTNRRQHLLADGSLRQYAYGEAMGLEHFLDASGGIDEIIISDSVAAQKREVELENTKSGKSVEVRGFYLRGILPSSYEEFKNKKSKLFEGREERYPSRDLKRDETKRTDGWVEAPSSACVAMGYITAAGGSPGRGK
jgi:hypothetical protein